MQISSTGIHNGIIADEYGKHGTQFQNGMPTYSLPFTISDPPEGTVSYALILDDKDSAPVCGFIWIHWLAANITRTELYDNDSQTATDYVQGANSHYGLGGGLDALTASCYAGMAPPDLPHTYTLTVYALDTMLDLKPGFFINELLYAMNGHILDRAELQGVYPD